jgi:hypothetical protein
MLWLRITLVCALWLIKFAFIALFFETREAFNRRWMMVLYGTATVIVVTFFVCIWTICKDIIQGWIYPTSEDVLSVFPPASDQKTN